MNRGDALYFCFKIKKKDSEPVEYIDGSEFSEVELQFNRQGYFSLKKLLSKGEIMWQEEEQRFMCFLTQKDTFKLTDGNCKVQVALFVNNFCKHTFITNIQIGSTLSECEIGG